jgi:hypothetical protein
MSGIKAGEEGKRRGKREEGGKRGGERRDERDTSILASDPAAVIHPILDPCKMAVSFL